MPSRRVIISAHNGVHARPVAELVRLVQAHGGSVTLSTADGTEVDLGSVLAVMDLGLAPGDEVVLRTSGSSDGDALLNTLATILAPPAA
jgi:phosphotransferase system HPr (HPr) family protein